MKTKLYAGIMAVLILSTITFAASQKDMRFGLEKNTPEPVQHLRAEYMPYYLEYPDMVIFKGVAVNDGQVKTALFLGFGKEGVFKFQHSYFFIDGKMYELKQKSVEYDSATRTISATYKSGSKTLDLVVVFHRVNYQEVLLASGKFNGHILNMHLDGRISYYPRILTQEVSVGIEEKTE